MSASEKEYNYKNISYDINIYIAYIYKYNVSYC